MDFFFRFRTNLDLIKMAGQYTRTETIQKNLYVPGSKQYLPTNLGNGSFFATYFTFWAILSDNELLQEYFVER